MVVRADVVCFSHRRKQLIRLTQIDISNKEKIQHLTKIKHLTFEVVDNYVVYYCATANLFPQMRTTLYDVKLFDICIIGPVMIKKVIYFI